MRLTRIAKAFDDPDYIFELKPDGFRAIAYIEAGECKLVSRNLNHFKSFFQSQFGFQRVLGPARIGRVTFSKTRKGRQGWQHYLKPTLLLCIQRQPLKPLRPCGRIVYPLFHLGKREA